MRFETVENAMCIQQIFCSPAITAGTVVLGILGLTLTISPVAMASNSPTPLFMKELAESGLAEVPGPLPGRVAHGGGEEEAILEIELPSDLTDRGSLAFWVRVDQSFRSGIDAPEMRQTVLEVPGVFHYDLLSNPRFFGFQWRWTEMESDTEGVRPFNNLNNWVPGVPGPAWIHVALEWDRGEGILNGYINGTPTRLAEIPVPNWSSPEINTLTLRAGPMALSGVHVSPEILDHDWLRGEVTPLYWGTLNGILGALPPEPSSLDRYKGELLHEWTLADADQVESWVMEGPGQISFDEGWMRMKSGRPDGPDGHMVFWPEPDLPEDFIAQWEIQMLDPVGLCIVFFCAKGRNGEDLFDPSLEAREGIFARYHSGDTNSYHISYFANPPHEAGRITSNMRKNHGFFLVANGPPGIGPTSTEPHQVTLMKRGNHIQLAVDDRVIIDFVDDGETYGPVLGGGKLGLRQMQWTDARYRNLRIYEMAE